MLAGRLVTERDRAASEPVVVINETMARTVWPGENPPGQTITTYSGQQGLRVAVGVVGDVRHEASEQAPGKVFGDAARREAAQRCSF